MEQEEAIREIFELLFRMGIHESRCEMEHKVEESMSTIYYMHYAYGKQYSEELAAFSKFASEASQKYREKPLQDDVSLKELYQDSLN